MRGYSRVGTGHRAGARPGRVSVWGRCRRCGVSVWPRRWVPPPAGGLRGFGSGSGGTTDWRRNTTPPNVNGGDGGGLSAVVLDTGRSSVLVPHRIELPLVIAAGGGYGSFVEGGGQPVFGSDGSSPAGLAGGPGYGGSAGSSGATLPEAVGDGIGAGGGGGAGWYGGGGGAAGGRIGGTGEANEPPGGGGGGLSLVPSGGTIGLSSTDSSALGRRHLRASLKSSSEPWSANGPVVRESKSRQIVSAKSWLSPEK